MTLQARRESDGQTKIDRCRNKTKNYQDIISVFGRGTENERNCVSFRKPKSYPMKLTM